MYKLTLTALLATATHAHASAVIDQSIIDEINADSTIPWTAGVNNNWLRYTNLTDVQSTALGYTPSGIRLPAKEYVGAEAGNSTLPAAFDAREQWGGMCASVSHIYNQAQCGSCWAVSTAAAASDRACIASSGAHTPVLASKDLLVNCQACGYGCQGGDPSQAWQYYIDTGLVSGGDYGSTACLPYPFAPCNASAGNGCANDNTPPATKKCTNTEVWTDSKLFGQGSTYSFTSVQAVQQDIMTYGSVVGTFNVYSDFMHYKSGVYVHKSGQMMGGHAVKVIGWGTADDGTDYWLILNSWGEEWGLNGAFMIKRGTDESGIDSGMSAGHAPTA